MKSQNIWFFATTFFEFSIMFSMFIHALSYFATLYLLLLNYIPLYGEITFGLSSHQWVDIWIVSTFQPFYIMLLSTFMLTYCFHFCGIYSQVWKLTKQFFTILCTVHIFWCDFSILFFAVSFFKW